MAPPIKVNSAPAANFDELVGGRPTFGLISIILNIRHTGQIN